MYEPYGAIGDKWRSLGGYLSGLGAPVADEVTTVDGNGRMQEFEKGTISWSPDLGTMLGQPGAAFAVFNGPVRDRWVAVGREKFGYPSIDSGPNTSAVGEFCEFTSMHEAGNPLSAIYYTPNTGAHEIYGAIYEHWRTCGGLSGPVGLPVAPESGVSSDERGRAQEFASGTIVWHRQLGAAYLIGAIRQRWIDLNGVAFGYPTSDQLIVSGNGRRSDFTSTPDLPQRGACSISFTDANNIGAHEVYGAIWGLWFADGAEQGVAGYPMSPERDWHGGPSRIQDFHNRQIVYTPGTGARYL